MCVCVSIASSIPEIQEESQKLTRSKLSQKDHMALNVDGNSHQLNSMLNNYL